METTINIELSVPSHDAMSGTASSKRLIVPLTTAFRDDVVPTDMGQPLPSELSQYEKDADARHLLHIINAAFQEDAVVSDDVLDDMYVEAKDLKERCLDHKDEWSAVVTGIEQERAFRPAGGTCVYFMGGEPIEGAEALYWSDYYHSQVKAARQSQSANRRLPNAAATFSITLPLREEEPEAYASALASLYAYEADERGRGPEPDEVKEVLGEEVWAALRRTLSRADLG